MLRRLETTGVHLDLVEFRVISAARPLGSATGVQPAGLLGFPVDNTAGRDSRAGWQLDLILALAVLVHRRPPETDRDRTSIYLGAVAVISVVGALGEGVEPGDRCPGDKARHNRVMRLQCHRDVSSWCFGG